MYTLNDSSRALEVAAELGLGVTYPASNELYIDLDTNADKARFDRVFAVFKRFFPVDHVYETPSRSKAEGRHIRILLSRTLADSFERVALQAMLGSDGVREVLAYARILGGDPVPTMFFEKPEVMAQLG